MPAFAASPANIKDLATVIQSEASVGNHIEQVLVGFTVLNRMVRNGKTHVSDVWDAFAHTQKPRPAIVVLATTLLIGFEPDVSHGATHFYSPRSMPKEGESTAGFDVAGGLEQTAGLDKQNYRPGWALTLERIMVDGVREPFFKFYRQPGHGSV